MKWDSILPYINNAVRTWILPYFGNFYETVCDHNTVDTFKDEIKDMMSNAIANYAIYLAMPHLNITIADMGVQQNRNEKSANANQWSYNQARWSALYAAERQLDQLLNFVYKNRANQWLQPWVNSDAFKGAFADFIVTRDDLANVSPIKTMRGFWSVLPEIRKSEEKVNKMLGFRTYASLSDPLSPKTDEDKHIIMLIQYYIASQAVFDALPGMTVIIEDGSLYNVSTGDFPNIGVNSSSNLTMINTLRQSLHNDAQYYESEIRNYLLIKKDHFTDWAEDCYVQSPQKGIYHSGDRIGGIIL